MTRNKCLAAVSVMLLVGGCATSDVVSTGPQSFSLSATRCGICAPVTSYVTEQAGNYCQSKNKQLVVRNITSNNMQPMFPGSATINFSCVSQSDPNMAKVVFDECKKDYERPDLNPIRGKVEIVRDNLDAPPPFAMASNEDFPTDVERQAIEKWANLRDACITRQRAARHVSEAATALQATVAERDTAYYDEVTAKVSALIVALYQRKMTYGEFAEKRYEFSRDGAAAEREYRQAMLNADQQLGMQAQQLAQQNFQNKLAVWSTYLQAVNARQPQTVVRVQQNVTVH
jgi:hypothetical protein